MLAPVRPRQTQPEELGVGGVGGGGGESPEYLAGESPGLHCPQTQTPSCWDRTGRTEARTGRTSPRVEHRQAPAPAPGHGNCQSH